MISSISDHKNKKLYEKVIKDISQILQILSLAQRGLSIFKSYITVQEIISVIATNITLLELQQKKYINELQTITKKHSEQD